MTAAASRTIRIAPRDVPCLATNVDALTNVALGKEPSPVALERVIALDLGLTTRVLATANSSFFGCSGQIDSIHAAVALVGAAQVRATAAALLEVPPLHAELGATLWTHARACAVWTRFITTHLKLPNIPYLYTAGLLHDVGIVLLLQKAPETSAELIEQARGSGRPLLELERREFGFHHAELSARACALWNLPDQLTRTVAGHHDADEHNLEGSVLMLADVLARSIGLGEFAWSERDPDEEGRAAQALNADVETLLEHAPEVLDLATRR